MPRSHRVSDEAAFLNYGGDETILRGAYGRIRDVAEALKGVNTGNPVVVRRRGRVGVDRGRAQVG